MKTSYSSILVVIRAEMLLLWISLAAPLCKLWAGEPSAEGQPHQAAASICCIPEYHSDGTLSTSPSFWVSNQTSRSISVTLESFLFPVGTNWMPGPPGFIRTGLMFQTPRGRTAELLPGEAAYGDVDATPLALPVGRAFRVQACISERLTGLPEVSAKVRETPKLAELRLVSGNTNVPYHAFQKTSSFYRSFERAVTPEVLITNAPMPSPRSRIPPAQKAPQKPASPEEIANARAALRDAMTNGGSTAR
jgi:hypothetical protein